MTPKPQPLWVTLLKRNPMVAENKACQWVTVARIRGAFGVRGELRVEALTEHPETMLTFDQWRLLHRRRDPQNFTLVSGRRHGPGLAVRLQGIEQREAAKSWNGAEVQVPRDWLPTSDEEGWTWIDLMECRVVTDEGEELGQVDYLFETGANDVLVVQDAQKGERLLPLIEDVILDVDLEQRVIKVHLLEGL